VLGDKIERLRNEVVVAYCKVFRRYLERYNTNIGITCEPDSSVSIVSGYGLDNWAIDVRSPAEARGFFPPSSVSRPALGPTQPPVQWVPGVLSPGVKPGRGVTLTTHPHLVPRSRMSRSYTSSPPKRDR
jgi:hypothetical protein